MQTTANDLAKQSGRRETKKRETSGALLKAAIELFEQKGYDNVSVDEIALAAGVSRRTFFRYFDSKDEVVFYDSKERMADFSAEIAKLPPNLSMSERYVHLADYVADIYMRDRDSLLRQRRIIDGTGSLGALELANVAEWENEAIRAFAGDDPDRPSFIAQVYAAVSIAAFRVALRRWYEGDAKQDLRELTHQIGELLLDGLGESDESS